MKTFLWFKAVNYYIRARIYLRRGIHNQAIANFDQAIKLMPTPTGYQGRGIAYVLSGKPDQAIIDFNQALKIEPNNARTYGCRAEAYSKLENYVQAITDWSQAIQLNPNLAGAYRGRAVIYWINGDYEKASNDIRKAKSLGCKIPPELSNIFRQIEERGSSNQSEGGEVLKSLQEKEENKIKQEENLEQAKELVNNGINFFKTGLFDKAIDCFTEGLKIDPNNVGAHFFLGLAYGNKGDQDKAIDELTAAIEINPNHLNAYYNRGNEYFKRRDFDKAIADYTMAIKLNPKDVEAYYNYGIALREKGKFFFPLAWTYIRKAESLGYKGDI